MPEEYLFDVPTPLGFRVHTTSNYWADILGKHPDLAERLDDVTDTLMNPDEVRGNFDDPDVHLFYRRERPRRYLRVIVRRIGVDGFLISAFPSDYIKAGERIWPR